MLGDLNFQEIWANYEGSENYFTEWFDQTVRSCALEKSPMGGYLQFQFMYVVDTHQSGSRIVGLTLISPVKTEVVGKPTNTFAVVVVCILPGYTQTRASVLSSRCGFCNILDTLIRSAAHCTIGSKYQFCIGPIFFTILGFLSHCVQAKVVKHFSNFLKLFLKNVSMSKSYLTTQFLN